MLLQTVTRETFWTISPVGEAVFYFLAAVAVLVFSYGVYERFARYTRGTDDPIPRLDDLPERIGRAARLLASNRPQFDRDWYAGVMHAFIVWGFLTLLIGTTILAIDIDIYRRLTGTSFFVGDFYLSYSLVMDALGLLFVVGVGMALYRRYRVREERLWGKHTGFEDDAFIWTLFLLGVGGYLTEALRIVGTGFPSFETVSFVGYSIALVLDMGGLSAGGAEALYTWMWWSHAILALVFVAAIPYAKPFHMLASFANIVTRDEKAGVRLPRVPEHLAPDEIGYTELGDVSWRQLLDMDACTKCGRCSSVCPAKASGRNLDPRDVILDLKAYRDSVDADGEEVDIIADGGSVIAQESMESCMACMACMDACPVDIEHLTHFTEMNRRLTETGQQPEQVQEAMMNVFQNGNAFGDPARTRPEWTEKLDFEVPDAREESVEFLWYVGDYPSYDERNQRVSRALARILHEAGVSYGILYEDEANDGNDVRRVGEEGLYEMLVEDNASIMNECDFEKIVCTDPHSYNTFMNEYPEVAADLGIDFDYPVYHYTELLKTLVKEGRLDLGRVDRTVTYHDPCHLGRYNGVFETPRSVIEATGVDLVEMPRNRKDSFCCGGGGGGLWLDHEEDTKPSEERLREATEDTDRRPEQFVVACPMCATMYEDGRKTGGFEEELEIVDVSELVVEALDASSNVGEGTTPAAAD